MRDLASIQKIISLEPIEGKDRIELATILGWKVIVGKEEFKVGDLVIYVEYDTILPEKPEFEFLRSRCWSKMYKGFRIKNMSMGGVFSQGIVFSLDLISTDHGKFLEGRNVAEQLGVVKYDPEEIRERKACSTSTKYSPFKKWLLQFKIMRKILLGKKVHKRMYPETVHKSSETNIQKNFSTMQGRSDKYYLTEKLEGQAGTFLLLQQTKRKREYMIFSHNAYRSSDQPSNWKEISDKYELEILLRDVPENLAIQGEIIGPGIQGNIYGLSEKEFYVYKISNTDTGVPFTFTNMKAFCELKGLPFVPVLGTNVELLGSVEEMLKHSDGESLLKKGVKREGVIWRSMSNQDLGCKVKSRKYAVWFEKKHGRTE